MWYQDTVDFYRPFLARDFTVVMTLVIVYDSPHDPESTKLRAILSVLLLSASCATLALAQTTTTPATPPTPPAGTTTTPAPAAPAPATPPVTQPATPPAPAATPPAPEAPAGADQAPPAPGDAVTDPNADPSAADGSGEDVSVGDIPDVVVIELKPDVSRKALDVYVLVREKYKDEKLEDYESLQDFVNKSPKGKDFEADVKAAGFASLDEWNNVITNLSFAYGNMIDDQTADLKQQIEEIKNDTTMAQDMKDRMIKAIAAMIPSDNNKKIVEELSKDPAYADKVKLLETESE
jgi:pyruvate/2-oxoglutarate dehydrogenase complex dihydrolipoamide acyltransferase (E2) component